MWAIFRLRFNLQISYTRCVGWMSGGWVRGGRDLVVSIVLKRDLVPPPPTHTYLYSCSVSYVTTWRWSTYRTETCSCILSVLIGKIQLCSTVRVIHKILCYRTNTTGMTHLETKSGFCACAITFQLASIVFERKQTEASIPKYSSFLTSQGYYFLPNKFQSMKHHTVYSTQIEKLKVLLINHKKQRNTH